MITLTHEDLQRIIYNGMVVAITQSRTQRALQATDNNELLLGLHEQAGKMSLNVQNSPAYPIDLDRIASVL